MQNLAYTLGCLLKEKHLTITTAESCTAGGIGAQIASIDGSSAYFIGGIIAYATELKIKLLGLTESTINTYGVVSQETAIEMNKGVRRTTGADLAISVTGFIGTSGEDEFAENGTVWICIGMNNAKPYTKVLHLHSDRITNAHTVINVALEETIQYINIYS